MRSFLFACAAVASLALNGSCWAVQGSISIDDTIVDGGDGSTTYEPGDLTGIRFGYSANSQDCGDPGGQLRITWWVEDDQGTSQAGGVFYHTIGPNAVWSDSSSEYYRVPSGSTSETYYYYVMIDLQTVDTWTNLACDGAMFYSDDGGGGGM